jgi:hypothetical protein
MVSGNFKYFLRGTNSVRFSVSTDLGVESVLWEVALSGQPKYFGMHDYKLVVMDENEKVLKELSPVVQGITL